MTALFVTQSAFAATNPTTATETESVATSSLSVAIPVLYRISGVDNLTTANYTDNTSSVSLSMNDDVCIYTNAASGTTYKIKMKGSSTCAGTGNAAGRDGCPLTPSDAFAISSNANTQHIPYEVYFNDETGVTNRAAVGTEGGAEATIANNQDPASRDPNCVDESGTNANFSVDFDRADLLAVKSGTYTGTLTITLIPPT